MRRLGALESAIATVIRIRQKISLATGGRDVVAIGKVLKTDEAATPCLAGRGAIWRRGTLTVTPAAVAVVIGEIGFAATGWILWHNLCVRHFHSLIRHSGRMGKLSEHEGARR